MPQNLASHSQKESGEKENSFVDSPRTTLPRINSDTKIWSEVSEDAKSKMLYIVLISLHGLVRRDNTKLGRDSDTGDSPCTLVCLLPSMASLNKSGDDPLSLSDDDSDSVSMEIMSNYKKHCNPRKRVCKSASDRRFREMAATVRGVLKAIESSDWVILQETFKKMNKQLEKVVRVLESERILSLYIKALVMLEDFVFQAKPTKEAKKMMGRSSSKALNALTQNLKKNNKQYEELIIKYRENPKSDEDGYSSEEEPHEYGGHEYGGYTLYSGSDEDGYSSEEEPHEHGGFTWHRNEEPFCIM